MSILDKDKMLESYIRDISSYPLINAKEEKRLADIIHNSSDEKEVTKAKEQLTTANLRLVINIAQANYRRFFRSSGLAISVMDLIQAGNVGLIRAVELFRSERNVKFSSYAYVTIERNIRRCIKEDRLIRVPVNHFSYFSRIKSLENENEDVTDEEVAKSLNIEMSTLDALRKSKNQIVTGEGYEYIIDKMTSDEIPLNDILNQRELREYLMEKINDLRPLEKWTIFYRFLGHQEMTLKEVGAKFGVTREGIRKAQETALIKLRQKIEEDNLKKKGDEHEIKSKKRGARKVVRGNSKLRKGNGSAGRVEISKDSSKEPKAEVQNDSKE